MSDHPYGPPDELSEALEGKHTDELVSLLALFRDVISEWGQVAAIIEAEIADRTPPGQHETSDGVPFTVRKGSTKTVWDVDLLWSTVTARASDERKIDAETGEVLESEGQCVSRVLRSVLGSSPNFVTGGVKDLGLDPNDYRQTEGRRSTVQL